MSCVQNFTLRIFSPKLLYRQIHLISTVLVKETRKLVEMEKFTPLAKFHTPAAEDIRSVKAGCGDDVVDVEC